MKIIIWQMIRRITNEILGVKGLSYHNRLLERWKYYIQLVKLKVKKANCLRLMKIQVENCGSWFRNEIHTHLSTLDIMVNTSQVIYNQFFFCSFLVRVINKSVSALYRYSVIHSYLVGQHFISTIPLGDK